MPKNGRAQVKFFIYFCLFFFLPVLLPDSSIAATVPLADPEYVGFIQQKINSYSIYPPEAREKGWEGVVKVKFTIADDGRVKAMEIAESSGYPLLDAAAMMAIKDASPYPFPEAFTGKSDFEVVIPVNYKKSLRTPSLTLGNYDPMIDPKQAEKNNKIPHMPLTQSLDPSVKKIPSPLIPPGKLAISDTSYQEKTEAEINENFDSGLAIPIPMTEELEKLIDIALKNNQPAKVAQAEVELAKLKISEAQRNLFPGMKISAYIGDGETYKVGYTERETKLQLDQPIFHGGVLRDSIQQAKVNYEITKRNYDRLKLDIIQKTETAYYNLIAARMHIREKESLIVAAADLLQKIEKLSSVDMIIPLEMNSSRSWFEQLQFHLKTIKQDLYMAETTLRQVLNTKGVPKITAQFLEAKPLELQMDTCLRAALINRPEIYMSELLVKFNDYGQKIEQDKEKIAVNFESSYGHYAGAYKTEKMKESDNWYAGFKATKPFGGSSLSASASTTESQPRFGQTSPTKLNSLNAEFSILDNLKRLSDKMKTEVDLYRAMSDMNESAKTVAFEVQDSFLNYQKAVLQLNSADTEMKYRINEAEVIKVRALTGETSLSSAMEAIFSLSDAQSKYVQAMAGYYIAIANLKKSTGYGIKL
ncbi:MAG: TonB family protein [Candidatus Omnitrophica bacterium]|nr:TonB family protein [Candidatus Omnitrophota bacterium]